ncbi:sporulation protein [Bacillus sp. HMF5848]|uniref:sporulation membrane protein YtrI n=1 Tax=Bacillus sp. HMF5848 TaxID=2495421 RepID=UPI000F784945|nr:sporulation membrane protein YtrI [Bacillus sp. HMF5848]RSK28143.1 sporulation protein [Bacillus sp. HMF5848]
MRIPPYYKNPNWQRFFAGMVIGAIISWCMFIYIYGELREKQFQEIVTLKTEMKNLQDKLEIWQEDYNQLNEENKKQLTVQDIKIRVANASQLKLDGYTVFLIQESAKNEIKHLLAKDIETVFKNKTLLKRAIENKPYLVEEKQYRVTITELFVFTTLYIELKVEFLS